MRESQSKSTIQPVEKFLALDTAGNTIITAVMIAGEIHGKSADRAESRIRNIAVLTEELLQEVELTFADIRGVIVALGPGSFTGLRVGLSFAKGIVAATDIPLVGVSRFQQILYQLRTAGDPLPESMFVPLKADSYYRYSVSNAEESQVDVVTIKELDHFLNDSGSQSCFVDCEIPATAGKNIDTGQAQEISATLEALFGAAGEKYSNGNLTPWTELEPLYVQRSGAEIRASEARKSDLDIKNANSKNV
jgi:tRNA threonylcarbamoyl adenosine modification protein YeaZ